MMHLLRCTVHVKNTIIDRYSEKCSAISQQLIPATRNKIIKKTATAVELIALQCNAPIRFCHYTHPKLMLLRLFTFRLRCWMFSVEQRLGVHGWSFSCKYCCLCAYHYYKYVRFTSWGVYLFIFYDLMFLLTIVNLHIFVCLLFLFFWGGGGGGGRGLELKGQARRGKGITVTK